MCDWVLTGDVQFLSVLEQVEAWMLDLVRPDIFDDGHEANVLTRMRRSFASLCAVMAEHGTPRAEEMPLYDFHARFEYLREQLEKGSR